MREVTKMASYKWVHYSGQTLRQVGILPDGTLHNPNGYPEDIVRAAVLEADERCRIHRSEAAKKAAETRARRREKKVYSVVTRLLAAHPVGPQNNCTICGRGLADAESINRGIGSECWQDVLKALTERQRTTERERAVPSEIG
jgi:Family of unknown function (DUF6011)